MDGNRGATHDDRYEKITARIAMASATQIARAVVGKGSTRTAIERYPLTCRGDADRWAVRRLQLRHNPAYVACEGAGGEADDLLNRPDPYRT